MVVMTAIVAVELVTKVHGNNTGESQHGGYGR